MNSIALNAYDSTEFCAVSVIDGTLRKLLAVLEPDSNINVNSEDLQCTVSFENRQKILEVGERAMELEREMESPDTCSLTPTDCRVHFLFALLRQMPALLNTSELDGLNETALERERLQLADDLETVIPYIGTLLQKQLEVSVEKRIGYTA